MSSRGDYGSGTPGAMPYPDTIGYNLASGTEAMIQHPATAPVLVDPVTGAVLPTGATSAAVFGILKGVPAPKKINAASERELGYVTNVAGSFTIMNTRQAPAAFDAIQITINNATNDATNTLKATLAVSDTLDATGYQPKIAGAAAPFVPVTWRSTLADRKNYRNPNGGVNPSPMPVNGSGLLTDMSLIEGHIVSDIIPIKSVDRIDGGAAPLLHVRIYGMNCPTFGINEAVVANANPWRGVFPEYFTASAAGDVTATTGVLSVTEKFVIGMTVTYFLRGKPVYVVGVAGDSIEKGWCNATAVPLSQGLINGWPRRFTTALKATGVNVSHVSLAFEGQWSKMFHERAYDEVVAQRLTHLLIKPFSVNEIFAAGGTPASAIAGLQADLLRCSSVVQACLDNGVVPVLIWPWGTQPDNGNVAAAPIRTQLNAYMASMQAAGVPVFDARSLTDSDASYNYPAGFYTVNSGGVKIDNLHLTDAGNIAIGNLALAQLGYLFPA